MSQRLRLSLLFRLVPIAALLTTGFAVLPAAQAQTGEDAYDLAAMLLRADDFDTAGLDGTFVRSSGTCYTPEQFAMETAATGGEELDAIEEIVEQTGVVAACDVYHDLTDNFELPEVPTITFVTYIYQFEDEDGAQEAFENFEDESDDPGAEDVEDIETIGDMSEATTMSGEDELGEYQAVDVTFVNNDLIGGVVLFDGTGEDVDLDLAVEFAEELLDRMDSVTGDDSPHLGSMVAPVEGEDLPIPGTHRYEVIDGEGEPRAGETEDLYLTRLETYGNADAVYSMAQTIPGPSEEEPSHTYAVTLYEFPADDDAVTFVEEKIDRLSEDEANSDITEVEDAPQYGDASVTVRYESSANDTTTMLERVFVAVDNYVVNVYVAGEDVPEGVTADMADVQVACVEDGGCEESVGDPEALGETSANNAGTDEDDSGSDDRDQDEDENSGSDAGTAIGSAGDDDGRNTDDEDQDETRGSGEGETFTSDLFPYSVSYTDDWEVLEVQTYEDEGFEAFSMSNGASLVIMIADSAHEGDVDACLDNAIAYIEDDPEVEDVEELLDENGDPIAGSDDDAAYAAISYVLDDGSEMALYAECRVIVPGEVTLEFNQFVSLDDFEDEADARDELLAGIETDN